MLLLNSMPETTAEHYRNKIAVYLQWYKKKGMDNIPQTQEGDIGSKIFLHGDVSAKSC
jgi:predicted phosphoadenosine phosphosulfate sulfurtransferase